MDNVRIYDATLYGGGQSPGATLNTEEKLEVARLLEQMRVDVIQAGFPIASPGEFKAVQSIASTIRGCAVCGLARARAEDVDVAAAALAGAARPRIQIGLGVSDSYIVGKLNTSREAALDMAVSAVSHARQFVGDVQYYAADAGRADVEYLYRVLEAVIDAGAQTVNIADAIGFFVPTEWGKLIEGIRNNVPNIDKAVISVHCHNDLGMASANTVESLIHGARQVECALNGLGERTGNARLEEVVMTLHTRGESLGLSTNINTRMIYPASQLVSHLTGLAIQPTKAIIGAKAFAYTSGMYQNGVLKGRSDAEVIDPADIGIVEADYGGPLLTGREGVRRSLRELGYTLDDGEFDRVYARFREVIRKKPSPGLRELEAIASGETAVFLEETYELCEVQVTCGTSTLPVAAVCLSGPEGDELWATSQGNGPVDAAYRAVDNLLDVPVELLEYSVEAMTEGVDALAKVTVRIRGEVPLGEAGQVERRIFLGRGADTDVIVASVKAYLFALNRQLAAQRAGRRQKEITEEVRRVVEDMHARYGTAHTKDFMGWSVLRDEKLI